MKKLLYTIIFFLIISPVFGADTSYYVTQSGTSPYDGKAAGSAWRVSDFNTASNWDSSDNADKIDPGDTVYFSGPITTTIQVQGSGTAGNYITLDGYEAGECDPIGTGECGATIDKNCTPSLNNCGGGRYCSPAITDHGIVVVAKDYIIIQDFTAKNLATGIYVAGDGDSSATADWVTIRRNYITNTKTPGIWVGQAEPSYSSTTNCTIGGELGNGNLVYNSGWSDSYGCCEPTETCLEGSDPWDVEARGDDLIVSYNKFGNDGTAVWPGNILECGDSSNVLIEYNDIYGASMETGIALKEHGVVNAIVRFNKVHDCPDTGQGNGITATSHPLEGVRTHNVYIYGNEIYGNYWGITVYYGAYNVHIWSNIIRDNIRMGIAQYDGGGGGVDGKSYSYMYNNVIADNGTAGLDEDVPTGIYMDTSILPGSSIKNNIFYNNRAADISNPNQIYIVGSGATNTTLEHNTYYHTGGTAHMYWNGTNYTLAGIQGIGQEDAAPDGELADPGFMPGVDNYRLDGTNIDDGADLSECFDITIQGTLHTVCYQDALHPSTDWTTTPPTVVTASQGSYGIGWERGAYVSTGPLLSGGYPTAQQAWTAEPTPVTMGATSSSNSTLRYSVKGTDTCATAYGDLDAEFSDTTGQTAHTTSVDQAGGGSTVYVIKGRDDVTGLDSNCLEITVDVAAGGGITPQPAPRIIVNIDGSANIVVVGDGPLLIH